MKEQTGNIWTFHEHGEWIAFTSNGTLKMNRTAVMGAGIAKQVARKFPSMPRLLGKALDFAGNHVFAFPEFRLLSFPVKHDWKENADIELIKRSCGELTTALDRFRIPVVYVVRPGCGLGGLKWEFVKPAIENLLDDRVVVVEFAKVSRQNHTSFRR